MRIQQFTIGSFSTNAYLVYEAERCTLIDAPYPMAEAISFMEKHSLIPDEVLLTHGHFDHILGLGEVRSAFPDIRIFLSQEDRFFLEDDFRATKETLRMMGLNFPHELYSSMPSDCFGWDSYDGEFSIIKTPGHTPGSVSFYSEKESLLFSGDTLFRQGIGRTDLGGSYPELIKSLERLSNLPGDTLVLPGHGFQTDIRSELG